MIPRRRRILLVALVALAAVSAGLAWRRWPRPPQGVLLASGTIEATETDASFRIPGQLAELRSGSRPQERQMVEAQAREAAVTTDSYPGRRSE